MVKQLPGAFQRVTGYIVVALGDGSLAVDLNLWIIGAVVGDIGRRGTARSSVVPFSAWSFWPSAYGRSIMRRWIATPSHCGLLRRICQAVLAI